MQMSSSSSLEWSLHIVSREHQLEQSYTVLFFLGTVPESQEEWRSADSLLGTHVSFTWTGNVPEEYDHNIESFLPLQRTLKRKSGLAALTPDLVVPYLSNNLHWRVQKSDGDVVDSLSSLKVTVFSMHEGQKERNENTEYPLSRPPFA